MFTLTEEIKIMLEQGYQDVLKYCYPCILNDLKRHDSQMFAAKKEADQIFNARCGARLIETCSEINVKGTIEKDGVPPEKISCGTLMAHRLNEGAEADFRARWEVMLSEIDSDLNIKSTRIRFNLSKRKKPSFIQRYLNYRLWGAFYTFGERHKNNPELYINTEEREKDKEILRKFSEKQRLQS